MLMRLGKWRSLVSVPALGAGGRGFESPLPDQYIIGMQRQNAAGTTSLMMRGSDYPVALCGCSSMAEPQPSKLVMRVRFPSPAPLFREACSCIRTKRILTRRVQYRRLLGRALTHRPESLPTSGQNAE